MKSYKELLPQITTFIFDIDGVLTDGQVLVFQNTLLRNLNSKDGYALQYASKMAYRIFVITGGNSEEVKQKLLEVGVTEVFLRSSSKLEVYEQLKKDYHFDDSQALYMGDDIPDLPVLKQVAVSCCPQDAVIEVKAVCLYQSPFHGGKGCVRDIIEQTMKSQGKWMSDKAFVW